MPMIEHYNTSSAPFIPQEPTFNEKSIRESTGNKTGKGKGGGLAALLKKTDNGNAKSGSKQLTFDENHFQQFLKEDQQKITETSDCHNDSVRKRKRQNILGDFKFKKIDQLF